MEKVVFNFNIFDGVKTAMLCESEFSKEIRITMSKDAIMKEHRAPNAIIVQVLRGQIEFEMSGKIIVMNEFGEKHKCDLKLKEIEKFDKNVNQHFINLEKVLDKLIGLISVRVVKN